MASPHNPSQQGQPTRLMTDKFFAEEMILSLQKHTPAYQGFGRPGRGGGIRLQP
jgi:hypothetical protein